MVSTVFSGLLHHEDSWLRCFEIVPKSLYNLPKSFKNRLKIVVCGGALWRLEGGLGASWGGLGGVLGGLGASWGVVLADSGSQARLGRRPGRLVGDFGGLDGPNLGPKMASSWGLDRTKIDANIARIFDAFENRNLDGKN